MIEVAQIPTNFKTGNNTVLWGIIIIIIIVFTLFFLNIAIEEKAT